MKADIRGHENRSYLEQLLANAKKEQDERDKESKWYEEPKVTDYSLGNQYRQSTGKGGSASSEKKKEGYQNADDYAEDYAEYYMEDGLDYDDAYDEAWDDWWED